MDAVSIDELVRAGSSCVMLPSFPLALGSHGVGKTGAQALLVWLCPFRAAFSANSGRVSVLGTIPRLSGTGRREKKKEKNLISVLLVLVV